MSEQYNQIPVKAIPLDALPQAQANDSKQQNLLPVQFVQVGYAAGRDYRLEQRGLAPGGIYDRETFIGVKTLIGAGVCCFFTCCGCFVLLCPFDYRETYKEPGPKGRKVVLAVEGF